MPFNIYVTHRIPDPAVPLLCENCDRVDVNPHDRILTREELLQAVQGRDGVLCLLNDTIDEEVLNAAGPKCKVFANYAVGFNNVDIPSATKHGVMITNTPGVLTETTADLAWSLLMSIARRIVESEKVVRSGQWQGWSPNQFLGRDVYNATLGIIGAGRIGTAVARRATGFNMKILYTDQQSKDQLDHLNAQRVDLNTLLQQSDFISIHVPLNDDTHHLIGKQQLETMKSTAYLINTARGPVIDEAALVQALIDNKIAGAALDVYENEPKITPGLTDLNNVICIPHLGSATEATRSKMAQMAAENLLAAVNGQTPPNLVNPEVLEK